MPVARATIGQHAAVTTAIGAGDGTAAEKAMLELIDRTAASLEDELAASFIFEPA